MKYFVLGALSSGMLLYGASLIYGFTGSTVFSEIANAAQPSGANLGLIFGMVFLLTGFAFKISAVPFHMWTPDVYEGAPTPVTAFFAAAPKIAAMALFIRVVARATCLSSCLFSNCSNCSECTINHRCLMSPYALLVGSIA